MRNKIKCYNIGKHLQKWFFLNISDLLVEWESALHHTFYTFCHECGFIGYYSYSKYYVEYKQCNISHFYGLLNLIQWCFSNNWKIFGSPFQKREYTWSCNIRCNCFDMYHDSSCWEHSGCMQTSTIWFVKIWIRSYVIIQWEMSSRIKTLFL